MDEIRELNLLRNENRAISTFVLMPFRSNQISTFIRFYETGSTECAGAHFIYCAWNSLNVIAACQTKMFKLRAMVTQPCDSTNTTKTQCAHFNYYQRLEHIDADPSHFTLFRKNGAQIKKNWMKMKIKKRFTPFIYLCSINVASNGFFGVAQTSDTYKLFRCSFLFPQTIFKAIKHAIMPQKVRQTRTTKSS